MAPEKHRWREVKVVWRNSSDGVQMSVIQIPELIWYQLRIEHLFNRVCLGSPSSVLMDDQTTYPLRVLF